MKEKCSWYRGGICDNPNECPFRYFYYQTTQCRKGGLLKTPNKLKYLEKGNDKNICN